MYSFVPLLYKILLILSKSIVFLIFVASNSQKFELQPRNSKCVLSNSISTYFMLYFV